MRANRTAPSAPPTAGAESFDRGADPRFVEYYTRASESEETIARFSRILQSSLDLLREQGWGGERLDVADIGCGAGTQSLLWADAGHRVRAIDVNAALVAVGRRRAEERSSSVEFCIGSATGLPFPDRSSDVVLMVELLEHLREWQMSLSEAVRILRPGGLLYLGTSNRLCPRQQEFDLPLYSWYPGSVKRWCEGKAMTTRPEWANYARYPAVHWFTYYELRDWLGQRGLRAFDRFDVQALRSLSAPKRLIVEMVRRIQPLHFLGQVASEGTRIWALKPKGD